METTNGFPELEQMREQILILREKLETQKIVSERHVRAAIRSGVSQLNRHGMVIIILGIIALPWCTLSFHKMGMSLWFCGGTAAMFAFCIWKTWRQHRALWAIDLASDDLVTAGESAMKLRKDYIDWLKIGIPMLVLWFGWFVAECFANMDNDIFPAFLAGGCVGMVIGAALGFKIHRKAVRMAEEVLSQIEELRGGE